MSATAPPAIDSPAQGDSSIRYVGFWVRLAATLIDSILFLMIIFPAMYFIYGSEYFLGGQGTGGAWDVLFNFVLPVAATLLFWKYRSATPGKMIFGARIVDAKTLGALTTKQMIIRYFAYIPSMLVLGLGFLWIAWDPRKQSWHDKLAGTLVVRPRNG